MPVRNGCGEQSQISWAHSPKLVKTNEIARSLIITLHFLYNRKMCSCQIEYPQLFWAGLPENVLGYTVTKGCASPRNL